VWLDTARFHPAPPAQQLFSAEILARIGSYLQPAATMRFRKLIDSLSFVKTERKQNAGQFGSNNPFRNRASQVPPFPAAGPLTPASPTTQRPQSRNPFLDVFGDDEDLLEPPSRTIHKCNSFDASSTQRPVLTGAAADLFVCNYP